MLNYYKYLPTSIADEKWGLFVLNAGYSRIEKQADYPSSAHPGHHYFNWATGRVLQEYQLIYITRGEGVFHSRSAAMQNVQAGDIILLFPGEWHRFKPAEQSGWDELWVGFKGEIMENLVRNEFFGRDNPVLHVGQRTAITDLFQSIINNTRNEIPGYQALVSGMVVHLLGEIYSATKQFDFADGHATAGLMNRARDLMRNNIEMNTPIASIAQQLHISYAWFRKTFKNYTGLAPHQYLLQLRMEKAKTLLADKALSIKEIALKLNFESAAYFSKLFKKKNGVSPELYRKTRLL